MPRPSMTGNFIGGFSGTFKPYSQGIVKTKTGLAYIRMTGKNTEQRINSFFKKFSNWVCIGMALKFSQAAAKFTPPNIGKAYIDPKYYNRPIYSLEELAKGLVRTERGRRIHATKEDYEALRNGFKYKVVNTKYRATRQQRRHAVAYTKGINEAKRRARIENRGLSKYSWGGMMNNTEEAIQKQLDSGTHPTGLVGQIFKLGNLPPIFQRLLRKSPNIQKYNWGTYDWDVDNPKDVKRITFIVENRLAQIEAYGRLAISKGINAANRYCNSLWRGVGLLGAAGPTTDLSEEEKNSEEQIALTQLRKEIRTMFEEIGGTYHAQVLTDVTLNNNVQPGHFQIRRN